MEIFHQRIKDEKSYLGVSENGPTTYITVHRDKLLEDGYQQLGLLSKCVLKETIKVKFINAQVSFRIVFVYTL